jgi:hypothetical protein
MRARCTRRRRRDRRRAHRGGCLWHGEALLDIKDTRHRDVVLDGVDLHGGDETAMVELEDRDLLVSS